MGTVVPPGTTVDALDIRGDTVGIANLTIAGTSPAALRLTPVGQFPAGLAMSSDLVSVPNGGVLLADGDAGQSTVPWSYISILSRGRLEADSITVRHGGIYLMPAQTAPSAPAASLRVTHDVTLGHKGAAPTSPRNPAALIAGSGPVIVGGSIHIHPDAWFGMSGASAGSGLF